MATKEYVKNGLLKFKDLNPNLKDKNAYRREALRLEREYQSAQRNIQRAKEMFPDDPFIPAIEKGPDAFAEELKYQQLPQSTKSMYPRLSRSTARGEYFNPIAGIADVASMPGRLVESGTYKIAGGEQPFSERMEQTEGTGFVSEMVRDPLAIPSVAIGGPTINKGAGFLRKGAEYFGRGLGIEGSQALASQAEQMSRGEDFDPVELGLETGLGVTIPGGLKAGKKSISGVKNFAKDLISESTNRTRELLDVIGTRELKQSLKKGFKKAGETVRPDEVLKKYNDFAENAERAAKNIIRTVDNIDNTFRENNKIVDEAISAMPKIDSRELIKKLQSMKKQTPSKEFLNPKVSGIDPNKGFGNEIAFNNQLDGMINKIKFFVKSKDPDRGKSIFDIRSVDDDSYYMIDADDFLGLRREIDSSIDWNAEKFSKSYMKPIQKTKKDIRTYMKNVLLENADKIGNKEYSKAMEDFHKAIQIKESAQKLLMPRYSDVDDVDRSQKFLLQISNPNQLAKRKWAKKFKEFTGYDLLADANLLRLSREYRGALPMVNDYRTGAKNFASGLLNVPVVGGAIGTALGSPKFGAALYGAMDYGDDAYSRGIEGLSKYSPQLRGLMRTGIRQGIGE